MTLNTASMTFRDASICLGGKYCVVACHRPPSGTHLAESLALYSTLESADCQRSCRVSRVGNTLGDGCRWTWPHAPWATMSRRQPLGPSRGYARSLLRGGLLSSPHGAFSRPLLNDRRPAASSAIQDPRDRLMSPTRRFALLRGNTALGYCSVHSQSNTRGRLGREKPVVPARPVFL